MNNSDDNKKDFIEQIINNHDTEKDILILPFSEGEIFKNYPTLCEVLNEKVRGGTAKKAQLKRWEKYFKWEKKGHKFIITEIKNERFPADDTNDKQGKPSKEYYTALQKLILNVLYLTGENNDDFELDLTLRKMIGLTNITNPNFLEYRFKRIGEALNYTVNELGESREFGSLYFQRVHGMLYYDFRKILEVMEKQKLIDFEEITFVKPNFSIVENDFDYESIENFGYGHTRKTLKLMRKYYHDIFTQYRAAQITKDSWKIGEIVSKATSVREAERFERSVIVHIENMALESLGFSSTRHLYASAEKENYYYLVNHLLDKYLGLDYVYRGYRIFFSPSVMKRHMEDGHTLFKLEKEQRDNLEKMLNEQFCDTVEKNYVKYYKNSLEKLRENKELKHNEKIVAGACNPIESVKKLSERYIRVQE